VIKLPKIHVDNDTYELLLKLKGQKLIRGEKTSISSLVREAIFTVYGASNEVSKKNITKQVDIDTKKFWEIINKHIKVTREIKICDCGGEIIRTMAFKSFSETIGKEVVHRVLAVCTRCGEKYLMKLKNIKSIDDVKIKDRLMDWRDFQREVIKVNGVKGEWFELM